jgi:hypothetical protein
LKEIKQDENMKKGGNRNMEKQHTQPYTENKIYNKNVVDHRAGAHKFKKGERKRLVYCPCEKTAL